MDGRQANGHSNSSGSTSMASANASSSSSARWEEERFPDIVVGIDFGMTCTGNNNISTQNRRMKQTSFF